MARVSGHIVIGMCLTVHNCYDYVLAYWLIIIFEQKKKKKEKYTTTTAHIRVCILCVPMCLFCIVYVIRRIFFATSSLLAIEIVNAKKKEKKNEKQMANGKIEKPISFCFQPIGAGRNNCIRTYESFLFLLFELHLTTQYNNTYTVGWAYSVSKYNVNDFHVHCSGTFVCIYLFH